MSWWELALMIIAIAVIFGTVALVRLLKSVSATVETAENMMKENRKQIDAIVENIDGITNNTMVLSFYMELTPWLIRLLH